MGNLQLRIIFMNLISSLCRSKSLIGGTTTIFDCCSLFDILSSQNYEERKQDFIYLNLCESFVGIVVFNFFPSLTNETYFVFNIFLKKVSDAVLCSFHHQSYFKVSDVVNNQYTFLKELKTKAQIHISPCFFRFISI